MTRVLSGDFRRGRISLFALLLALAPATARCEEQAAPQPSRPNATQADAHAGHSGKKAHGDISVDVIEQDGKLHLLLGRNDGVQKLYYKSSADGGETWSAESEIPVPAEAGAQIQRGADARIARVGNTLLVMWMSHADSAPYGAGPMVVMRSTDQGKTWTRGTSAADWLTGAHGYFSLATAGRNLHATWLDSRDGPSGVPGSQGLRHAVSADAGASWSKNTTLDNASCACCWTTSRADRRGNLYVLYRDKQPSDMAIGLIDAKSGKWARLSTVGQFEWDFAGCPHIGGGLALRENSGSTELHALIGTRKKGDAGVYYLSSADGGRAWSAPYRLGDESATHGDIAARSDGSLAAVWDMVDPELNDGTGAIYSAIYRPSPKSGWESPTRLSTKGASASHPVVVATKNGYLAVWTETGPAGLQQMVTKRLAP